MAMLSMPKDAAGQKKLLFVLIPIALFAAYWFFLHTKKVEEAGVLQARLEELETKNTAAKTIALRGGPELQQKLALYEQHMKRLEELIPKADEVASLLNSLAERALDANVDLSLMKPDATEPGEFYIQQTYQVQVIGGFHEIGRYLASVASGPRIVTPVQLTLVTQPATAATATRNSAPRLNADFKIVTYVIPPPPSNEPAATPAAGGNNGTH